VNGFRRQALDVRPDSHELMLPPDFEPVGPEA
jgi:hypothetical protein